jgi:hypothetical protein
VSPVLSSDGPFGLFADRLLLLELPNLPPAARRETVEFVCRRAGQTPTPLKIGVVVLALATDLGSRAIGADPVTGFLRDTRLPFVGELARMVRSLGFTYVWETWPDTAPTGAAA